MLNNNHDSDLTNFGTWLMDNSERVFRYWIYKKKFTPYEKAKKYLDESVFVNDEALNGKIVEAIELPDGDILLGFQDPESEIKYINYHKLSEINLAYSESDMEDEEYI